MSDLPTHWTQFDRLYDLTDPRPYFRGVATGDYRMPGVLARIIERLLPVLEIRRGDAGPVRLVDFACGYGAVGLCLRGGRTMADLYHHFAKDAPQDADVAAFRAAMRHDLPPHRIDGIDIAENALAYARAVAALDGAHCVNLLSDPPGTALLERLGEADMIFESGAIGDHISDAVATLLRHATGPRRPWILLCPRPRIATMPVQAVLAAAGYRMAVLVSGVRYRRAFSEAELMEEVAAGMSHGLRREECTIDGYFRVDIRLAIPEDENFSPARSAVIGFDPESVSMEMRS